MITRSLAAATALGEFTACIPAVAAAFNAESATS
jgi:hypothetical protein